MFHDFVQFCICFNLSYDVVVYVVLNIYDTPVAFMKYIIIINYNLMFNPVICMHTELEFLNFKKLFNEWMNECFSSDSCQQVKVNISFEADGSVVNR